MAGCPVTPKVAEVSLEEAVERPYEQAMRHLSHSHGIHMGNELLENVTRNRCRVFAMRREMGGTGGNSGAGAATYWPGKPAASAERPKTATTSRPHPNRSARRVLARSAT